MSMPGPSRGDGPASRFIAFIARFVRSLGENRQRSLVTRVLIAACVLLALAERFSQEITYRCIFTPALAESQPYRFLTSAFLHAGFWHIVLNMYALWLLGCVLEPMLGRWRFLALYLLSAIGGNVAVLLTADPLGSSWGIATVGASGAVFGLLGALVIVYRIIGADMTNLLVVIGLNVAINFIPNTNISWQSHIGGFVMGVLLVFAMSRTRTLAPAWRTAADAAADCNDARSTHQPLPPGPSTTPSPPRQPPSSQWKDYHPTPARSNDTTGPAPTTPTSTHDAAHPTAQHTSRSCCCAHPLGPPRRAVEPPRFVHGKGRVR